MMAAGGKRPGSGRKPKADEQKLVERLKPLDGLAFDQLAKAIEGGERWAVTLFFQYRYGKPVDRKEISAPAEAEIVIDLNKYI